MSDPPDREAERRALAILGAKVAPAAIARAEALIAELPPILSALAWLVVQGATADPRARELAMLSTLCPAEWPNAAEAVMVACGALEQAFVDLTADPAAPVPVIAKAPLEGHQRE
jgi:hypothetical protein